MSTGRISVDRYRERIGRAQAATAAAGARALLIGVGTDMRWLLGYAAMPLERLTMIVIPPAGRPTLVAPRLEQSAAMASTGVAGGLVDLSTWTETENPIDNVVRALGGGAGSDRLLVSDWLGATFLLRLQAAIPGASWDVASSVTSPLRQVKDAEEIALLRDAAHAADRTVARIFGGKLVGRTEASVARDVRAFLVEEGHDMADFFIVASGPNSASPHHEASDRVIRAGEPIVLDIGGNIQGYHSDITRTCWVTGGDEANGPDEQYRHLFNVLESAQAKARAAIKPGMSGESIDSAARSVIDGEGYGDAFFHRTGHGIGLDGHEDPYIVSGNGAPLVRGNAFSVEPGIYLEGRYGARIEDIVVCGASGVDDLNEAPRSLAVVSGLG